MENLSFQTITGKFLPINPFNTNYYFNIMIYFKVPKAHDNKRLNNISDFCFIKDELFTLKECEKLKINISILEKIEIPKNEIYFSFGVRFEKNRIREKNHFIIAY